MAVGARQLSRFRVYRSTWADLSLCHSYPEEHSPQSQKDALSAGHNVLGGLERDLACDRGTVAHEHCEYVLKTATSWLDRALTRRVHGRSGMMDWLALQSSYQLGTQEGEGSSPKVTWPAREYARGLSDWLVSGRNGHSCASSALAVTKGLLERQTP